MAVIAGTGLVVPWKCNIGPASAWSADATLVAPWRPLAVPIPDGTLIPSAFYPQEYVMPPVKLPAPKRDGRIKDRMGNKSEYCRIATRQFQ